MMKQKFSQETGLIKSTPLYLLTCAVLLVVLAVSVLSAVTFGTVKIPVSQVYRVILHELFGVGSSELGSGSIHDVVWLIRLPRLILAVAAGMGLSVCGVPAGAYDVEVQAVGTVKGADGTLVEVCSEVYTESVTVPAL